VVCRIEEDPIFEERADSLFLDPTSCCSQ